MRTGDSTTDHAVFACRNCDNFVLGSREYLQTKECCNETLREVTESDVTPTTPTLETIAREVFGLPKNGFDICLCTIEEGAATVATIADRLGYDRSVITRYLNTLSETGLLQKTARIRKQGGEVNVYYPLPLDEIKREIILGLYLWSAAAAEAVDDMAEENVENGTEESRKVEPNSSQGTQTLATVFWD